MDMSHSLMKEHLQFSLKASNQESWKKKRGVVEHHIGVGRWGKEGLGQGRVGERGGVNFLYICWNTFLLEVGQVFLFHSNMGLL